MSGSATAGPNTSITLTDLAAALAAYLGRQLGAEASVSGLRRLPGGASRETWLFTLATPDGAAALMENLEKKMAAGDKDAGDNLRFLLDHAHDVLVEVGKRL